jgi:hypothetical protein
MRAAIIQRIDDTDAFQAWIARVEAEIAADVNAGSYRQYFDAGLTPAQAVLRDRQNDAC